MNFMLIMVTKPWSEACVNLVYKWNEMSLDVIKTISSVLVSALKKNGSSSAEPSSV